MFSSTISNARKLLVIETAVCLFLTGCMGTLPWPQPSYKDVDGGPAPVHCPNISGVYSNLSDGNGQCGGVDDLACRTLGFYLLSQHVPEGKGVSNIPTPADDWPSDAVYVVLEQQGDEIIRVLVRDLNTPLQLVKELRSRDGDFRCTSDAVDLKPRMQSDFIAVGLYAWRRNNRDDRALRKVDGGAISITSYRNYSSYLLGFIGGTAREEFSTVQWPAITLP